MWRDSIAPHMPDRFWWDDYMVLVRGDRLMQLVPSATQKLPEQLNAVVRFCAYAAALLYMYTSQVQYLYLLPAALMVTKVLHDSAGAEQLEAPARVRDNEVDLPDANPRVKVEGQECVPPTKHNPFMNVLLSDYKYDPERPAACPMEAVKDDAMAHYYDGLFRDADDVFGQGTAARNFYTMPVTETCNDQSGFARWCYSDLGACKGGDMNRCQDVDLRQQRPPIFEERPH